MSRRRTPTACAGEGCRWCVRALQPLSVLGASEPTTQVWACRESANAMSSCLTCVPRALASLPLPPAVALHLTRQGCPLSPRRARSGHTDAAALEALKLRWIKAGKPNLTLKCVTRAPGSARDAPARPCRGSSPSLTRSPRKPTTQLGVLSVSRGSTKPRRNLHGVPTHGDLRRSASPVIAPAPRGSRQAARCGARQQRQHSSDAQWVSI